MGFGQQTAITSGLYSKDYNNNGYSYNVVRQ